MELCLNRERRRWVHSNVVRLSKGILEFGRSIAFLGYAALHPPSAVT